jgi:hypothetical protein
MKYWSSSEATQLATDKLSEVWGAVDTGLAEAIAQSSLADFDVKIRYIPIIMDEQFRARYPARSRVERKNRVYNCCPQLDHHSIVTSAPAERALIYLEGLRECGAGLAKLGATPAQVAEFDAILDEVGRRVAARLGH